MRARAALLDALAALGPQRGAVVLVGAQAIIVQSCIALEQDLLDAMRMLAP